jgi:hypothetical protein
VQLRELAALYTASWCSQDASRVAGYYARDGALSVIGCSSQQKVLYPPSRNQPFSSKVIPTAYADGTRLTGQADDGLVPCGNRFGRLSSRNRSHPVLHAGEQTISGEANPCCCVTLSLPRPANL